MGRLEEANDQLEQLMQQLDFHRSDPEVRASRRFAAYPQMATLGVNEGDAQFQEDLLGACVLLQGRIQERIGCKQEALSNYWRALQLDPFCFEALICLVRLAALTYQQRARSLLSRSFTLTSQKALQTLCSGLHLALDPDAQKPQKSSKAVAPGGELSYSLSTATAESLIPLLAFLYERSLCPSVADAGGTSTLARKGEPLGGRAAAAVVAMEASGPLSGGARSDSLSAETLVAMHSEFPSMRTLVDAASLEGGVRCGSLGAATSPAHTESTLNDPSGMSASRAIAAEAAAPAMLPSCLTRLISREKFRELDEKLGSSAYVLTGRARAALELGDLKGAFLLIQRAFSLDPFDADLTLLYINILTETKRKIELLQLIHKLESQAAPLNLIFYATGAYYFIHDKYELTRKFMSSCCFAGATRPYAHLLYAHSLSAERDHENALNTYAHLSVEHPGLEMARIGLAAESSAQRHDQFSRLILEQFCTAPEPDGAAVDECDPQALHELGLVFFRSKKFEEAKQYLERALRVIIRRMGLDVTRASHKSLLTRLPERWEPLLNNLAFTCRKLGRLDEALDYHEAALAVGPLNAEAFAATSHTLLLKALELLQAGGAESAANASGGASCPKRAAGLSAAQIARDSKIVASELVSRAFSHLQKARSMQPMNATFKMLQAKLFETLAALESTSAEGWNGSESTSAREQQSTTLQRILPQSVFTVLRSRVSDNTSSIEEDMDISI